MGLSKFHQHGLQRISKEHVFGFLKDNLSLFWALVGSGWLEGGSFGPP